MNRDYELGFILNPEVSEEGIRAILERIEQIVTRYDGRIVKVNQWGRRRMAYPIQRHRDGYYIFIDMILTPETVFELERILKVSEVVMREMVRRRDPKAVQKEREDREAREVRAAAMAAAAAATPAPTPVAKEGAEPEAQAEQVPVASGQEEQLEQQAPTHEEAPVVAEEETAPSASAVEETASATPAEEETASVEA